MSADPAPTGPPGATGDEPSARLVALLVGVAEDLAGRAELLNRLDAVAGDGDLGVTVTNAAAGLREAAPVLAALAPADAVRRIGTELARLVPSTGGTLVAFAFMAAGRALAADPDEAAGPVSARLASGLVAAAAAVAERGHVAPGDKTMLDALGPAAEAAGEAARRELAPADALRAAAAAADRGAATTASMRATTGRAGWLADRSQGSEDAGARLVALALAAAAARLEGR